MFCIQCEQTTIKSKIKRWTYYKEMCAKTVEVLDLQDVLIGSLQTVSF